MISIYKLLTHFICSRVAEITGATIYKKACSSVVGEGYIFTSPLLVSVTVSVSFRKDKRIACDCAYGTSSLYKKENSTTSKYGAHW